jgi:AAA+ ATPase superfamily predicted ATPase
LAACSIQSRAWGRYVIFELEHFSGRLEDKIKQDFYAMMEVSNMLGSGLKEANEKMGKERAKKEVKYEYRAKVNHEVGMLKDRLIGILTSEERLVRTYV